MTRTAPFLRDARPADAEALGVLWAGVLRRADVPQQIDDVRRVMDAAVTDPDARMLVAECDGVIAGAVYLQATTLTPLNLEPVVLTLSPHVLPAFRGRGVGRALMDAGVSWAEDRGIGHVATGTLSGSREANRFMARLSLAPQAVLRVATTGAVRARLSPRGTSRQIGKVVAARRSQRQRRPVRVSRAEHQAPAATHT